MSTIIGEKEPIVQVKYTYKLNELLLTSSLNPDVKYIWYFYRKGKNGTWDSLGIKKEGKEVSYYFTEKSLGRSCMFKVYAITSDSLLADYKSKLIGEFYFSPRKSSEQKIKRVTLFNIGAKDINKASYADKLIAKAECVGMYGKKILFHLWEDSVKTDEENVEIYKTKKSYSGYVNKNGIAEVEIPLASDENVQRNRIEHFMANGKTEKVNNEYYVTATYDGSDLVANKVKVEVTQEKKIERAPEDKTKLTPPKPEKPRSDSARASTNPNSHKNNPSKDGRIKGVYILNKYGVPISDYEFTKLGDTITISVDGVNILGKLVTIKLWTAETVCIYKNTFEATSNIYKQKIYLSPSLKEVIKQENKNVFSGHQEVYAEVIFIEDKVESSKIKIDYLLAPTFSFDTTRKPAIADEVEKKKEETSCICKQYDLIWGNKVSCEFRKKVVEIAKELWGESQKIKMANELMICMALETGKRFTAKHGFPKAAGLIQFTDTAVADMNRTGYNGGNKITKEYLANLTAVQQLTYVKLYFDMWKTHYKKIINNSLDMYLTIWCPAATGKSDDYVCYSKERDIQNNVRHYESNKSIEEEYYDEKEPILENRLKKDKSLANGKIEKKDLKPRFKFWTVLGENNKAKSFTCQAVVKKEEKNKVECGKCNEEHYNLLDKVKWQTQFDPKWGDKKNQKEACKKTCDDILIKVGLKATSPAKLYQTALENQNHTAIIINKENSKKGIEYMNKELKKGNPVQVGVDHKLRYGYNEGTTDHFIVVIGKGCENGRIYYRFYDVGTIHKDKGVSNNNRLYFDKTDYSLKGETVYNGNFYTVTQIRINL